MNELALNNRSFLQETRDEIETACVSYLLSVVSNRKEEAKNKIMACKLLLDRTTPILKSVQITSTQPVTINYISSVAIAKEAVVIDCEATEVESSVEKPS